MLQGSRLLDMTAKPCKCMHCTNNWWATLHVQVMLKPIAQALNAVIDPTTQVWFAMQGLSLVI
jgi:hypothetical protein